MLIDPTKKKKKKKVVILDPKDNVDFFLLGFLDLPDMNELRAVNDVFENAFAGLMKKTLVETDFLKDENGDAVNEMVG
ncbi:hypothetical protein GIB67_010503 [Kingdonia uniflora]|uniref:Uncharacterized protein n=1 Tax=Kingdonia uniflora TaxID=39325 RepID=A0A7J7MAM8_9MAGN|nr:hypothetical protein GIB67_010503 [Kingdonia uniflora]